jgi:hypothetical protein
MSLREQLHAYIAQIEQRLRWSTVLRGFAIFTGSALVATLLLVTIANALAFSHGSVTAARLEPRKPRSRNSSRGSRLSLSAMAEIRLLNSWRPIL